MRLADGAWASEAPIVGSGRPGMQTLAELGKDHGPTFVGPMIAQDR